MQTCMHACTRTYTHTHIPKTDPVLHQPETWDPSLAGPQHKLEGLFNPFTVPACQNSSLKDAWMRLQTVYFLLSVLRVSMKILSHDSARKKKKRQKQFRVSHFALLLVVFKWHHGSEGVKLTKSLRQSREWCIHTLPSQEGQGVQVLLGWGWGGGWGAEHSSYSMYVRTDGIFGAMVTSNFGFMSCFRPRM